MALRDRINRIFGRSTIYELFVRNYGDSVVWPDIEKLDTYTKSFTGNGDLFTVINNVVDPASRIPIRHVDDEGEDVATSRTLEILSNPSPFMSQQDFIRAGLIYHAMYGNMYLNALKPDSEFSQNKGLPIRLEYLPPPYTFIKAGGRLDPIKGYVLNYGGEEREFDFADVLHWKEFNPDWGDNFGIYGMSRLKPIIKSITASDSGYESMVRAFQNMGAIGILTMLGEINETGGYNNKTVTKAQLAALKNQFRRGGEFTGDKNRGMIAATNKSVEWTNLGLSPVDLNILESLGFAKGAIADAFNYPNQLLSGSQDRTYNNYQEAERSAWTNARQPRLDAFLQKLGNWLIPMYGESGKLVADYSGVEVLQKNKKELVEWMVRASAFTRNEIREATGFDKIDIEEMDQVYIPFSETPINDQMPSMDDTEKLLRNDYRTE